MRAMIVVALASLAIPIAFLSPFLGLLAYCWLSYMRPQDMCWGIGYITFGLYTAAALFTGLVVKMRFQFFRWHPVTWIFLALWVWWAWCTYHAYDREAAMDGLTQISRIFLICLVTTGLCTTKDRLKWVTVAIAGSLLFHGTKLGIYGILSGGSKQLQPIGGLMSGNNENAIALNMALPFALHFALAEEKKWRRWTLWTVALLTTIAIILTYWRGGFLGLIAAAAVLVWHSRARWLSILVAVPIAVTALLVFAPTDFKDRIAGIGDAKSNDLSAQMRLQAWGVAATITAEHPVQGIGPKNFYGQSKRFPRPATMKDMEIHDTYLELSSSLGLTGLALYLVLVGAAWTTAARVRRDALARGDPRLRWFGSAATAIQASIAAFLVSSTFGSLAHFDLMYHMCALAVCLPAAFLHETDRLVAADLAALTPSAGAPGTAWAVAATPAVLPLSRYDERPAMAVPAPEGLPDFRSAAPVPPDAEPVVPSPSGDAAAADGSPALPTAESPDDQEDLMRAAERKGPPPRHTTPQGQPADAEASLSTIELEDMFIDPYGTMRVEPDEFLDADATAEGDEPPPPPPRRERAPEVQGAPWLSPLETRVLSRPRNPARREP